MWVCVVALVSACLHGCVLVRCVLWCRGFWCCFPPPASPVSPSNDLPRVALSCVPLCCGWRRCFPPGVRPSAWCPAVLERFILSSFSVLFRLVHDPCRYPVVYSLHLASAQQ